MNKNLFQVIQEAEEGQRGSIESEISYLQAIKTKIPVQMAAVKPHYLNSGEFEIYEFLDNCEFWDVKNKEAEGWFQTAGVAVANGKIYFFYDKEFIQRISKKPGELTFLIAHEMSHILRLHQDREMRSNKDHSLWNTATDMIINRDIMETSKIGGWSPVQIKGAMEVPDKFHKDFNKEKSSYYSENMYAWLSVNKKEAEKVQGDGPPEKKDYFEKGSIVRVRSGKNKGQYKKISKVNKDGTFETEPVDIKEEIRKVKGS